MAGEETIVAAATPEGRGALAVIRLSGPAAFAVTKRCLRDPGKFEKSPARTVTLNVAVDHRDGHAIDEITTIRYDAPHSFTGENMVELICHGGPIIVSELTQALRAAGARAAGRGEFTRRAVLNGKIGLLKAEGIRGLIEASSPASAESARRLYGGKAGILDEAHRRLASILAIAEATIEFEDEIDNKQYEAAGEELLKLAAQLRLEIEARERAEALESGLPVTIAGPANAGKSTLFNLLVGHARAIVHHEAGTTRDTIGERIRIANRQVMLYDTAGFRPTDHPIEREGISRSRKAVEDARLLLWVTAADEADEEIPRGDTLCVINKIDRAPADKKRALCESRGVPCVEVSLKEGRGVEDAVYRIGELVAGVADAADTTQHLNNQRHTEIAKRLAQELATARTRWMEPEMAAYHLQCGIAILGEVYGTGDGEGIMNSIFDGFCIGK